jgi:hypothetical protein
MLASFPASMVNQKCTDLGIPNRFNLNSLLSNACWSSFHVEEEATTLRKFIIERDIPKVGTFEREQPRETPPRYAALPLHPVTNFRA